MVHRTLSMRIKRLRKERGMSQEALATKAKVTREYVARLEAGRHDPSLSTLSQLAKALRVKVAELL